MKNLSKNHSSLFAAVLTAALVTGSAATAVATPGGLTKDEPASAPSESVSREDTDLFDVPRKVRHKNTKIRKPVRSGVPAVTNDDICYDGKYAVCADRN